MENALRAARDNLSLCPVEKEDEEFLYDALSDPSMITLLKTSHRLMKRELEAIPVTTNSAQSAAEKCIKVLPTLDINKEYKKDVSELCSILASTHFQELFASYDKISAKVQPKARQQQYPPTTDGNIRIVKVQKGNRSLGASIRQQQDHDGSNRIIIARISDGGAAQLSGLLAVGDEIVSVDGRSVVGMSCEEVERIMIAAGEVVEFQLSSSSPRTSNTATYLRAMFNYKASEDDIQPRYGVDGLPFQRRDILKVEKSQTDNPWWQAQSLTSLQSGMIPGKIADARNSGVDVSTLTNDSILSLPSPSKGNEDRMRIRHSTPYEEVILAPPHPNVYRPIVFIGAQGVGKASLKDALKRRFGNLYAEPVPHTSRPMHEAETQGEQYHFVSHKDMQAKLQMNLLLTSGIHNNNLYGITFESLMQVIQANKICLLDFVPKYLNVVRTPEFQPIIIFIKPPAPFRFRETRRHVLTDEECEKVFKVTAKYEAHYAHLFDEVVVNDVLANAMRQVHAIMRRYSSEPQWIPKSWVDYGPPGPLDL